MDRSIIGIWNLIKNLNKKHRLFRNYINTQLKTNRRLDTLWKGIISFVSFSGILIYP